MTYFGLLDDNRNINTFVQFYILLFGDKCDKTIREILGAVRKITIKKAWRAGWWGGSWAARGLGHGTPEVQSRVGFYHWL